jgi:transcriptional regulator GlxA family with amidase domain
MAGPGSVLTSAGITAGIDLALHLIERYAGAELAAEVARQQDIIAQDPSRTWTVSGLADAAHVSARHLSRLFAEHAGVSVSGYQQSLRIARARQLLTDPRLSVERVAELSGFGSVRDFRRVWSRFHTDTPLHFRSRSIGKHVAAAVRNEAST